LERGVDAGAGLRRADLFEESTEDPPGLGRVFEPVVARGDECASLGDQVKEAGVGVAVREWARVLSEKLVAEDPDRRRRREGDDGAGALLTDEADLGVRPEVDGFVGLEVER
jgi:hypothetical protein